MGFVPSEAEETPLDWYPEHIEQHLRENVNVENWILVLMRARLRARSTGAARGQGTPLDGELWQRPRDGGGRVVWERPNVRFSEALCSLGLVRYVDMFGGTDDDGRGGCLE